MNNQLLKIVSDNASLFWSINEKDLQYLSTEAVVETILSYGEMSDIIQLIEAIGFERTTDIFNMQASRPRSNYRPRTKNFFRLFFKHNAQRDT